jgi:putative transposase
LLLSRAIAHVESANFPVAYCGLKIITSLCSVSLIFSGGRHFWARGYFCVTSGELTEEMIKNYLENHFEPKGDDNFKTEA